MSSCRACRGNSNHTTTTKQKAANAEGDRAPTACLHVSFTASFGSGNSNTKTRRLLWSVGFPEHSRYMHFFPQLHITPQMLINKFVNEEDSRERKTRFNLCSVCGLCSLACIWRGHIRNLRLECLWNVSGSTELPV